MCYNVDLLFFTKISPKKSYSQRTIYLVTQV